MGNYGSAVGWGRFSNSPSPTLISHKVKDFFRLGLGHCRFSSNLENPSAEISHSLLLFTFPFLSLLYHSPYPTVSIHSKNLDCVFLGKRDISLICLWHCIHHVCWYWSNNKGKHGWDIHSWAMGSGGRQTNEEMALLKENDSPISWTIYLNWIYLK